MCIRDRFAIAGNMTAWMTENGKILKHGIVEPKSDRSAVQAYLKGRELIEKKGKEDEAIKSLTKAIEKYDRHAQAYERRGYINYQLKNYDDAIYDFTKSIDFSPSNPEPYLGRGIVHKLNKSYDDAIKDFDLCIKTSIPLQPIYWHARRFKAACHLAQKDYEGSLPDLKFFCNRVFKNNDPNANYKRAMWFDYGKALLEVKQYEEAFNAFDQVLQLEEGKDKIKDADKYLYRGIAREKAGKNGFLKDWKKAEELGSKKAPALLKRK